MYDLKTFWNEEDGFGTVELVILIAALVAIALLFGNQIKDFVQKNLSSIFGKANSGTKSLLG